MGADIHGPYIEEQDLGHWYPVAEFRGNRNYILFGLLAGVRGESPLFDPRGLPEDMSYAYTKAAADSEAWTHSHSWLTLDELRQVRKAYRRISKAEGFAGYSIDLDSWIAVMKKRPHDTRIIFWFDN